MYNLLKNLFLCKYTSLYGFVMDFLMSMGAIKLVAGLGTGHMTVTTHAEFIPEVWSKEVQIATEAMLVFAKRVKRFDSDVLTLGDTIHIPLFSNPTPNAKAANTAVTFQSTSNESSVSISIDQHFECSYLLEDITSKQSKTNLEVLAKDKAAYGLAKQVDTNVATLGASLSQQVGDYNTSTVSDEIIIRAMQYLDDADAPQDDRSLIVKPVLLAAMMRLDKFTSYDFRMGEGGSVSKIRGDIYGVPLFVSTNVYKTGNNTSNVMIHKEAFALAMQKQISVEKGRVIEYIGDAIVGQTLWGSAEYRDNHGVEIRS